MATVAGNLLMLARQPEFCFVVVEPSFAPGLFRMTVRTFFSQPSKMKVVLFMTIDTTRGRFPVFFARGMTVAALDGTMLPLENKICGFMTESSQIQLNNICASSLVIRVTVLALAPFHLGIATMKSFSLFQINAHWLVAR